MLLHYTTRTIKSRLLDSHQHEAVYGTAAFLNRAASAKTGVQGFEPCPAALETACSPRSPLLFRVSGGESNPPPRPSQGRMQNRYTTDTISSPGWIRTSDLSHVTGMSCPLNDGTGKYPDQDSNPERLVRSEE